MLPRASTDERPTAQPDFRLELTHERRCSRTGFAENGDGAWGATHGVAEIPHQGRELLAPAGEPLDIEAALWRIVTSQRGESGAIATLRLQPYPRGVGCSVERLVRRAMIRSAGYAN